MRRNGRQTWPLVATDRLIRRRTCLVTPSVLLREVHKHAGVTARVAGCFVDYRDPASVEHNVPAASFVAGMHGRSGSSVLPVWKKVVPRSMVVSAATIAIWRSLGQSTWREALTTGPAKGSRSCGKLLCWDAALGHEKSPGIPNFGLVGDDLPCPAMPLAAFYYRSPKWQPTTRGGGGGWPSPCCRTSTGGKGASRLAKRHFVLSPAGPIDEPSA